MNKPILVAMLATHHRDNLLFQRALPSIDAQLRRPARTILIDDAGRPDLASKVGEHFPWVQVLANRRTKGLAGALNSGLDHLLRGSCHPEGVFVAFLDDDDAWLPDHLVEIEKRFRLGAHVVATPFLRVERGRAPRRIEPPCEIRETLFQAGNPGIQGATFAVRLDILLEAGGFNEALQSCTDRDLWTRLARRPGLIYAKTSSPTVRHFACDDRLRLSSPNSAAKMAGLDMFDRIHGPVMERNIRAKHLERAERLFGWRPERDMDPANPEEPAMAKPAPDRADGKQPPLLVGVVVDDRRIQSATRLLEDLSERVSREGLEPADVLLLENRPSSVSGSDFAELVSRPWRNLRISGILRSALERLARSDEWHPADIDWKGRLAIADARTALQAFLHHKARERPGCVVWILDDDMRLDPLVGGEGDAPTRQPLQLARSLKLMQSLGADICIGSYTGAPPLPSVASVRGQFLDLVWNLRRLAALPASQPVPDGSHHNDTLRAGRRDYYHDLSRLETDRLETPFHLEPIHIGETCGEALARMQGFLPRILAGEAPMRPLVANAEEIALFSAREGLLRGGNTFVFDPEALRDMPNLAPQVAGRRTRRSDMIWALLQRRFKGRKVMAVPVPVRQDRSALPVPDRLDIDGIVDDLMGYAIFNAMKDAAADPDRAAASCAKYQAERLAALRLSFFRIRGLARELEHWAREEAPKTIDREAFAAQAKVVLRMFSDAAFEEIEKGVLELGPSDVRAFLERLENEIAEHESRLGNSREIPAILTEERVRRAREAVPSRSSSLKILGQGCEGVVFTDGQTVWKLFDRWTEEQAGRAVPLLESLASGTAPMSALIRPSAILRTDLGWLLEMPFEETEAWQGGHGPGLVELLADLHRAGLACRNVHPKNLRVAGEKVRLIDYGADLVPLDDPAAQGDEFIRMCRRAWLCWRWWWRDDLDTLMRRSLHDERLPELAGHENLIRAVRERLGIVRAEDPTMRRAMELEPARVLDYGAGKGKQIAQLAPIAKLAVAWDPDPAASNRLDALKGIGIQRAVTAAEAVASGPYDLVICRRVVCLVDDEELDTLLGDLRSAVAADGRVLLALCHPAYASRACTAEAFPLEGGRHVDGCEWKKVVRSTGRVLHERHRSERALRRRLMRAGFRMVARHERQCVEFNRFEIVSDQLVYELEPADPPRVSLLIKACAMDVETLEGQVRDILAALEDPGSFSKTVLALDTRTQGFLRQHAEGDLEKARLAARKLRDEGEIDQIVETPSTPEELERLNSRWFGLPLCATHSSGNAATAALLAAFDACETKYVLHLDVDMMIGRWNKDADPIRSMVEALDSFPDALTASFPVARAIRQPWTKAGPGGPWRVESRMGIVDLHRMNSILPLPNREENGAPALSWHRAMDEAVRSGMGASLRGGGGDAFCVHPPNQHKKKASAWEEVRLAIARGFAPAIQHDRIEWDGSIEQWRRPERHERFVFVICGRNVLPERFRRCWQSVLRQDRADWGAIVIDDASDPWISDEILHILKPCLDRVSFLPRRRRKGLLANIVHAVRHFCASSQQVILTLDADDCLIGDKVLSRIAREYDRGADLTVGSMLRTDKSFHYEVRFDDPRSRRGGNVWQHLRTFRKGLFDAIPDDALRLDGTYVELASDWAFMLPMVEMASAPVWIRDPLYLHEPGEPRSALRALEREEVIARLVRKGAILGDIPA